MHHHDRFRHHHTYHAHHHHYCIERQNVEEQNKFVEEYEEMGRYVKEQNAALEYALLQVSVNIEMIDRW